MADHLHDRYVLGCYRCELSRDEAFTALGEEVAELQGKIDAVRALTGPPEVCETNCGFCNEGDCDAKHVTVTVRASTILSILDADG